jgi:hypothetical protein
VQSNGTLTPISSSVPTLGSANCWNVMTPYGRFVYVSNSASGSISGFAIGSGGTLTPLAVGMFAIQPNTVLSPIWGLPAVFRQRRA